MNIYTIHYKTNNRSQAHGGFEGNTPEEASANFEEWAANRNLDVEIESVVEDDPRNRWIHEQFKSGNASTVGD